MDQQMKLVALTTASLMILLSNFSAVFGCSVIPRGQGRMRNLTVTVRDFSLPVQMVYGGNPAVFTSAPAMARSQQAARNFTENLVSEAIRDVLLENGRRAGLPDFVTMAILDQINVQINYRPLSCGNVVVNPPAANTELMPAAMNPRESCFIVGNTVTTICAVMNNMVTPCTFTMMTNNRMPSVPVPNEFKTITATITVNNAIMANWSNQQWQTVLNRMLRLLTSRGGPNFIAATITVN